MKTESGHKKKLLSVRRFFYALVHRRMVMVVCETIFILNLEISTMSVGSAGVAHIRYPPVSVLISLTEVPITPFLTFTVNYF